MRNLDLFLVSFLVVSLNFLFFIFRFLLFYFEDRKGLVRRFLRLFLVLKFWGICENVYFLKVLSKNYYFYFIMSCGYFRIDFDKYRVIKIGKKYNWILIKLDLFRII